MSGLALDLTGARILRPGEGLVRDRLSFAGGRIVADPVGRRVDLSGCLVLPGIVDAHGDGFERHVAPRRGAVRDLGSGLAAAEAEMAVNGITTGVLAQFWSWEGGLRGPDFAARILEALQTMRSGFATDLIPQLRFETHLLEDYDGLPGRLAGWGVRYVVFNDHLPHDRLAQGRRPPRLTGQALKSGRSPESHLTFLKELHARSDAVPAALDRLCPALAAQGVAMGSHDDRSGADRAAWRARGARISEFPETEAAARAARDGGDSIILGAPNVMRGGSHKGNVAAAGLVADGLCDALASDYHYPAPRLAALGLARDAEMPLGAAWRLVSEGPARLLGLTDRGRLEPGMRADLVVLEADSLRVGATIAGGRVSFMAGNVAARFLS